jgi:hypothetical protein
MIGSDLSLTQSMAAFAKRRILEHIQSESDSERTTDGLGTLGTDSLLLLVFCLPHFLFLFHNLSFPVIVILDVDERGGLWHRWIHGISTLGWLVGVDWKVLVDGWDER